jgi:hypothetical protein
MKHLICLAALLALAGCSEADVASRNVSKAADNFEVGRRIVFFNGITDKYLLTIEGLCSIGNFDKDRERSVTCKVGPSKYKKHIFYMSDNVSLFAEQLEEVKADSYHYRVIFRPTTILPAFELDTNEADKAKQ